MTTMTNYGLLPKIAVALLATAAIGVSGSLQAETNRPSRPALQGAKNPSCTIPPQSTNNRYVLMLVFNSVDASQAAATKLFGSYTGQPLGCIADPDNNSQSIEVQGACPTDCKRPTVEATVQAKMSNPPGDPLSKLDKKPIWAIFFADAAGANEAADEDADTKLRVWTIAAKDSCHAGHILQSLHQHYPDTFSYQAGYIGEMMIGYHSPKLKHGKPTTDRCQPWTPPPPPHK